MTRRKLTQNGSETRERLPQKGPLMNALSRVCRITAVASLLDATALCLADDVATATIPGGKANQRPNVILDSLIPF